MATELREMLTVSEIMERGEQNTYYDLLKEGQSVMQALNKIGRNWDASLIASDWERMMEERRGNNE